ncbi:hypothetical protein GCM10027567_00560 [Spongiibacter taiwanensis]
MIVPKSVGANWDRSWVLGLELKGGAKRPKRWISALYLKEAMRGVEARRSPLTTGPKLDSEPHPAEFGHQVAGH